MLKTTELIKILSGQRNDAFATATRTVLAWVTPFYRVGLNFRNKKFDRGNSVTKVNVPVISIGNLTTGGTGKTPMVAWVVKHLDSLNVKTALLSRGYGRGDNMKNDEALELESRIPNTPHLQNRDRCTIAFEAVNQFNAQALVLDDGFQHRKLHRDLDIVLIDATQPFGFGHLIPRGLLREPLSSLKRADAIVLTRANQINDVDKERIRETVLKHNRNADWAEAIMRPSGWLDLKGTVHPIDQLQDTRIYSFCGIGNPLGFKMTLEQLSLNRVGSREFPDHHAFTKGDVNQIMQEGKRASADVVVCTHKDLVKLKDLPGKNSLTVFALLVDVEFESGGELLLERIAQTASAKR